MSISLLNLNNLSVGYRNGAKQTVLFEKLSLSLHAGELVCFMGPNGVGKSTLIRTIAGLQMPLAGSIPASTSSFEGSRDKPAKNPKEISVVLTDRVNAMNMTVRELVSFGRYPFTDWNAALTEDDERMIDRAVQQIHIGELCHRNINELSDGQLQLVMIARALAQDTPVMLLDEPTAHLDLNNRLLVMNTLRSIARETNKAILVSTHELDLALQTADLLWLADGKKIRSGIPEDLVLDGSLDRIFQFKGFDLKTGRVQHEAHRGMTINLVGEGHRYLWTKNALERCGYEVGTTGKRVEVRDDGRWSMANGQCDSLKDLLNELSHIQV